MHIQWKWTIPNVLSLIRIAILPLFVVLYLTGTQMDNERMQYVAFVLLVVSGLTDLFDGWIARRFNQMSEIGKLLDPIADKLTQVAVMFCLATQYKEFLPLLFICMIKESLQGLGGLIVLSRGAEMRPSRWYGKVSTAVFYIAVATIVLWKDMPSQLLLALVILVGLMMLFAFVRYLLLFLSIRKDIVAVPSVEMEGSKEQ
jgi:cardiolipin synthase